jgi:hypothetical protein
MPYKSASEPKADRLGDFEGHLIAIHAKGYKNVETSFGNNMTLQAEVHILKDDQPGSYMNLGLIPIFWAGVKQQAEEAEVIGSEIDYLAGRLRQGTESNPRAWQVAMPTKEDIALLEAYDASLEAF